MINRKNIAVLSIATGCFFSFIAFQNLIILPPPPEQPLIKRNLKPLKGDPRALPSSTLQYNMKSYRTHNGETSPDGRILLKNNTAIGYAETSFVVFRPEANPQKLFKSTNTIRSIDRMYSIPKIVPFANLLTHPDRPNETRSVFKAHLCQVRTKNPQTCGADDCYQFKVILFARDPGEETNNFYLASRGVTVTVTNPKTSGATVSRVTIDPAPPIFSDEMPFGLLPEMNFTRDGKLLVGRHQGGSNWKWVGANGSTKTASMHTLIYSYSDNPCDVTEFGKFRSDRFENLRPIAAAYHDTRINTKYGFARYKFRDTEGIYLEEEDELFGNYGWVDWSGANIIFYMLTGSERLCDGTCEDLNNRKFPAYLVQGSWADVGSPQSGVSVAGLWTHGKIVMLDGMLNFTDFGVSAGERGENNTTISFPGLYSNTGPDFVVEVNDSSNGVLDPEYWDPTQRDRWVKSAVRFSSLQNTFNYHKYMQPMTPRDVVWNITKGHVTDEVAFDDYIDPHVYIMSEMNGSVSNLTSSAKHNNGFLMNPLAFDSSSIRLQNSATSPIYQIPRFGRVTGPSRIEPVALGGVRGKGFWLSGENRVSYSISSEISTFGYYLGLFVDTRSPQADVNRILFEMPRRLVGSNTLATVVSLNTGVNNSTKEIRFDLVNKNNDQVDSRLTTVTLPTGMDFLKKWNHLGILVNSSGNGFKLFFNGNFISETTLAGNPLSLVSGDLVLGGETVPRQRQIGGINNTYSRFLGWTDEFRLVIDPQRHLQLSWPEMACNYAAGTMLGMNSSNPSAKFWNLANNYSASWVPVSAITGTSKARYMCWVDYTKDYGVNVHEAPDSNSELMRNQFLFKEGPLVFNQHRPESRNNKFCLTCHVTNDPNRPVSLNVGALQFSNDATKTVTTDRRKQPMQPPANFRADDRDAPNMQSWTRSCLFGHWPAGTVQDHNGSGVMNPAISSNTCIEVDEWIFKPPVP